jgi:hypothetical protein
LVTTTSQSPGAATNRFTPAVRLVGELNVTGLAMMSDCPVIFNLTVAPLTKCVPVTVRVADPPFDAAGGLTEETVGPSLIVRHPVHVPVP